MSRYAYLLCVPDREYVWLGKLVDRAGLGPTVTAVDADGVGEMLRAFLATHLEHELRTVAEDTPGYRLLDGAREQGGGARSDP